MKKSIVLLLATLLVSSTLSLVACGGGDKTPVDTSDAEDTDTHGTVAAATPAEDGNKETGDDTATETIEETEGEAYGSEGSMKNEEGMVEEETKDEGRSVY